ncbi:conserved hypothetical protein [Desulfamplus magnetovallimortis]|uniref:histidine kinase n=1 Tax=Desulfamplus magnetovallimortis TaxID=1246637 RepID=A0A1W1HKP0_9BACT|nr:ATP-binding protein [Desulfamplus magnetovallimortis]SLM33044.1 conserved hypothetical protein [Desulfamplus magnetovallimortis]
MYLPDNEMETILNGIKDFILIISPDKEVIEVNDAFLRCMNCTREDVIGKKCYEVFKEATRKSSNCDRLCPLEKVIRNKRHCQVELTRQGPDGRERYAELAIFPIWKKKGEISKFIEISRDITKRKRDEQEIKGRLEKMVEERTKQLHATHEKLLHQDKMASLGKLSASVVHEINNPVAGILNLTLLSKRIIEEGPVHAEELELFSKYLNLMETETRRISRIVSNLLVFARQSKVEPQKLDINHLIEESLFINANLLKINGTKLITKLDTSIPPCHASEDQLKQVFMNFISNAAESMAVTLGGVLTVRTEYQEKSDSVLIRFTDTGIGIPQENIPKLFDPFFTTKKMGKGVGLGLSVAYGIIKEHGGTIYVNSRPGEGATFKITLPRRPALALEN